MRLTRGTDCGGVLENVIAFFKRASWLSEKRRAGGVERSDGLTLFDARAAAGVEKNAGMGIDGFSGFFTARACTLDGPADFGGIHGGDEAGFPGLEHLGCAGLVEGWDRRRR